MEALKKLKNTFFPLFTKIPIAFFTIFFSMFSHIFISYTLCTYTQCITNTFLEARSAVEGLWFSFGASSGRKRYYMKKLKNKHVKK